MNEHMILLDGFKGITGDHEKQIVAFLRERLPSGAEVKEGAELKVKSNVSSLSLRTLLRKYLAREKLLDDLRVISLSGALVVKTRRRKRI